MTTRHSCDSGTWAMPHAYCGLWAIEQSALSLLTAMPLSASVPRSAPPRVQRERVGRIALITLRGPLMKGWPIWGGTSTLAIRRAILEAALDPEVSAILLVIESPGGTVAGTAELADEVKAARKSKLVWAHIDDLGASAAYWVASQAGQVFANNDAALVGSIGTMWEIFDTSGHAEKLGVKAFHFATGPLKGAGAYGTPINQEQQSYFQGLVNAAQVGFDRAVQTGRHLTLQELAAVRTGGVFTAGEALRLKLIDGVQSMERTLAMLESATGGRRPR